MPSVYFTYDQLCVGNSGKQGLLKIVVQIGNGHLVNQAGIGQAGIGQALGIHQSALQAAHGLLIQRMGNQLTRRSPIQND